LSTTRFDGRSALVTGAASGIGRATAVRLAFEGAAVVATDIDGSVLGTLVAEAGELAGSIVTTEAGVLSFSHSHEVTLPEWNRLLAINLTGTVLVCRQALPYLVASRGTIVNLASTAAHKGQPWAAAYVASKGGVLALARSLAVEYAAAGVRVNSISPGAIDTPITGAFRLPEGADPSLLGRVMPLGPFGTPEGIAAAIAFVASDEASRMNDADVLVDGATLAWIGRAGSLGQPSASRKRFWLASNQACLRSYRCWPPARSHISTNAGSPRSTRRRPKATPPAIDLAMTSTSSLRSGSRPYPSTTIRRRWKGFSEPRPHTAASSGVSSGTHILASWARS
jgi:NAD(P)-dependent dehydrogenase (short-subunit alcohol dehydrogenase family)